MMIIIGVIFHSAVFMTPKGHLKGTRGGGATSFYKDIMSAFWEGKGGISGCPEV